MQTTTGTTTSRTTRTRRILLGTAAAAILATGGAGIAQAWPGSGSAESAPVESGYAALDTGELIVADQECDKWDGSGSGSGSSAPDEQAQL